MVRFLIGLSISLVLVGATLHAQQDKTLTEFRTKAEAGDAAAQYNLGVCYTKGLGVATNMAEAVKWFRKSAEQNLAPAQYNLGVCFARGLGVTKDLVEAVKWYRKAAEQNLETSQYDLGVCYTKGLGVTKDEVEGLKWLSLAAWQGNAAAKATITTNRKTISLQQMTEGIRRANEWLEQWKKRTQ